MTEKGYVRIAPTASVVKESVVMGDVTIGEDSCVLFYAVLRGDDNRIVVGSETNIQDNCTVHTSKDYPTVIGNRVTVGHNAILHGCTIGDETLIGMGATVMDGTVIGKNCLVAAGSLVPKNKVIPDGQLVMGNPARIRRPLTAEEIAGIQNSAAEYVKTGKAIAREGWCR